MAERSSVTPQICDTTRLASSDETSGPSSPNGAVDKQDPSFGEQFPDLEARPGLADDHPEVLTEQERPDFVEQGRHGRCPLGVTPVVEGRPERPEGDVIAELADDASPKAGVGDQQRQRRQCHVRHPSEAVQSSGGNIRSPRSEGTAVESFEDGQQLVGGELGVGATGQRVDPDRSDGVSGGE
jgi:hypothetical protein